MLIAIIGESCTGKSTLADRLKQDLTAVVYTGKDYLRMAKNPAEAETVFCKLLEDAVFGQNIIYVISEKQHLALLPEGAVRILCTAPLETIKERFRMRMRGVLPPPVEQMLTRNHGMFDLVAYTYAYDGDYEKLLQSLQ